MPVEREVRTRFAPSPTGRLHLGNVRVAVFNWLFARRHGGAFVLRMEDTDVERNREGSEQGILEDLRWLGLEWDEGPDVGGPHGPYRQSERADRYRDAARALLADGHAYRCWCTPRELEADAEPVGPEGAGERVLRYGGRCRRLDPEERRRKEAEGRPWVLRFALLEGVDEIEVVDEVRGRITFPAKDLDDFVILRSDGRPTYNFAVVVDDADMEITHVIRGVGHLSNMPKQTLLFDALGHPVPAFAHLPTVLAPEGGKLSKRTGSASVDQLRALGYNPDGVVNYLSLLGWSAPDEREVMDRRELVERIGLDRIGVSDTAWDPDKLRWMSGQHVAALSPATLVDVVRPWVEKGAFPLAGDEGLAAAVEALRSRLATYGEIEEHLHAFFFPPEEELRAAWQALRDDPEGRAVVAAARERILALDTASPEEVGRVLRETGRALSVRGPALYHPVRRALTGQESGPDLTKVVTALGREESARRLGLPTGSGAV